MYACVCVWERETVSVWRACLRISFVPCGRGWRKKAAAAAFEQEICSFFNSKGGRGSACLPTETLREDILSFKSGTGREREVQLRKAASRSCEAEVMDSAQRTVTVFS